MAEISVNEQELELHLSVLEEIGSIHGSIKVPRSAVTGARAVEHPIKELRGLKMPGTGVPGVMALGTWVGSFGKDFCAVDKKGPGVVIDLDGQRYHRLIACQDNPQQVVEALGFGRGG